MNPIVHRKARSELFRWFLCVWLIGYAGAFGVGLILFTGGGNEVAQAEVEKSEERISAVPD